MDPWSAFLQWLTTIVVPDWGQLISMLPLFLLIGVVGPIVTVVAVLWVWYLFHRRRGRVRISEPDVVPARRDASGFAIFPTNTPFCELHALIYPPNRTTCDIDGGELSVLCPVDDTVRVAGQQVCRVCGTRYILGAARTPLAVQRPNRPPAGGETIA